MHTLSLSVCVCVCACARAHARARASSFQDVQYFVSPTEWTQCYPGWLDDHPPPWASYRSMLYYFLPLLHLTNPLWDRYTTVPILLSVVTELLLHWDLLWIMLYLWSFNDLFMSQHSFETFSEEKFLDHRIVLLLEVFVCLVLGLGLVWLLYFVFFFFCLFVFLFFKIFYFLNILFYYFLQAHGVFLFCFLKIYLFRDWKDGSAVKSTDCSSKGPKFKSQQSVYLDIIKK
jgi:hypothetical protein